jgi:hypothetical protein
MLKICCPAIDVTSGMSRILENKIVSKEDEIAQSGRRGSSGIIGRSLELGLSTARANREEEEKEAEENAKEIHVKKTEV